MVYAEKLCTKSDRCRNSIPHLTELQLKYKDKGVVFIGITSENESTAKKFVNSMGDKMEYLVAVDSQGSAEQNYMAAFGIRGIPHAFVVGRDGKIVYNGHPMESGWNFNTSEICLQS